MSDITKTENLIRILWAVDPIDPEPALIRHSQSLLTAITQRIRTGATPFRVEITPVHVLTEIPDSWFSGSSDHNPMSSAQVALDRLLASTPLDSGIFRPLVLIPAESSGSREAAEKICQRARQDGHDLIVTASHGRRGYERLASGSFAEELLLAAPVPVLIAGLETAPSVRESFDQLLFATDLSLESHQAFQRFLPLAKALGSSVKIYHSLESHIEQIAAAGASGGMVPWLGAESAAQLLESEKWEILKRLEDWRNEAIARGVPCSFEINQGAGNLAQQILECADRNHVSMVALASLSGRLSSTLFGSVTRELVRSSHLPAWVLHEQPG